MNFFEHQDQAHRNTVLLVFLFGVAIASIIAAFYIVVLGVYLYALYSNNLGLSGGIVWFQPGLLIIVTAGTLGFVGLGSLFKTLQLRGGGKVVAQSLGGQRVNLQTQNEDLQRLLNVVEEMAIASGVPVPPVYVLTQESGINAFAAGFTMNDAVIGVTSGCIDRLTRDELQGIIAHEFSHILNGDMRLNLRIVGVLQGILLLYLTGRVLLRGGAEIRGRVGAGMLTVGLVLVAVGGIGFFFGRLIKSAVSRQREFLADASAVQFTRNPLGISSALRKIGGLSLGSRVISPKAEEASHMFFGNINRMTLADPFATHPPLKERIRRLESLSKTAGVVAEANVQTPLSSASSISSPLEGAMGFQGGGVSTPVSRPTVGRAQRNLNPKTIHVDPDTIVTTIGTTDPAHLAYAKRFLEQLPTPIHHAFRSPWGAQAVIYGLLLDADQIEVRDRQLSRLQQTETLDLINTARQVSEAISKLDPRTRLPLVDLTIPALRELTPKELSRFFKQIQELVRADGRLSLSEYTLQIVLQRRLQPSLKPAQATKIAYTTVASVWADCLTILAGLARVGHTTPEQMTDAFRSGVYRLPGASRQSIPAMPTSTQLYEIGQSLNRLSQAAPKVKRSVVDACAHTVLLDKTVTMREAELLRTIVIALDCPIPPFLDATPLSNLGSSNLGR